MSTRVRPAAPSDAPAITALLLRDAVIRETLEPVLWAIPADAAMRVEASLHTIANPVFGPIRHHWLVAEVGGVVVGAVHGINLPSPPIYDLAGGTAGLLFDDSHIPNDAGIAAALVEAAEQAMRAAGAAVLVAASPEAWKERTDHFAAANYEVTTRYMVKTGLAGQSSASSVRPATDTDLEDILHLSARHRACLQTFSPVFWKTHPEAGARFGAWMRASLSMADRSMFVSGPMDAIDGFIIAQPASPLQLPPAHAALKVGLIDDFCAEAFEGDADHPGETSVPAVLLAAAEGALLRRGLGGVDKFLEVTIAPICPLARRADAGRVVLFQGRATLPGGKWGLPRRGRTKTRHFVVGLA